jgi:hypothetical protein
MLVKMVIQFILHNIVKFQMTIANKFKDALTRQANDAVIICSVPDKNARNSKSEQAGAELCQAQFKLG